jgi:hypothetical protein
VSDALSLARILAKAERCQYEQSPITRPLLLRWARAARTWARRRARETFSAPVGFGPASRFKQGDWVRVRSESEIRATLDAEDKLRGLQFTPTQWACCGNTYGVERVVRRMIDDSLRMRTISRAVVLGGVTCDDSAGTPGCGGACALLFKDDWLEPAASTSASSVPSDLREQAGGDLERSPTLPEPPSSSQGREQFVRVRSASEIVGTLGRDGRLGGISPSPQMLALAGRRFRVARRREYLQSHKPLEQQLPKEWYILDGVRCDGQVLGSAGPCDRFCGLLWHESWLKFEELQLVEQTPYR